MNCIVCDKYFRIGWDKTKRSRTCSKRCSEFLGRFQVPERALAAMHQEDEQNRCYELFLYGREA